jgi:hypothetical protein
LNDGRLISQYFRELNANIVTLEDGDATRENIISTFRSHLINNVDIKPGSALVFYFAGHGIRVKAPDGWETHNGIIEAICPSDEFVEVAEAERMVIRCIPDLTLNGLIQESENKHGGNIVRILVFCSAADRLV